MGRRMRVTGDALATRLIQWLDRKKFKYTMDLQRSNPLHGVYYFNFKNKQEELVVQLTWGLI